MQDSAAKKDTIKLQRTIIDGLEDVKAQDIAVFDTEHLSALFERVIIASGTSNRQTKALASSVRDAVREAGFPKPRMEGEDNGEWIIVDCGQAVVHVMQPAIRAYYHLEEIWGDKPVRLKLGAAKPVVQAKPEPVAPAKRAAPKKKLSPAAIKLAQVAAKKAAKAAAEALIAPPRPDMAKPALAKTAAPKKPLPKAAAGKTAVKTAAKVPAKVAVKTAVKSTTKAPAKTAAKKSLAKPAPSKAPAKPPRA